LVSRAGGSETRHFAKPRPVNCKRWEAQCDLEAKKDRALLTVMAKLEKNE